MFFFPFLCSGFPELALGILKKLIGLCFCDVLQPGFYQLIGLCFRDVLQPGFYQLVSSMICLSAG